MTTTSPGKILVAAWLEKAEAPPAQIPFQMDFILPEGGSNIDEATVFCLRPDSEQATASSGCLLLDRTDRGQSCHGSLCLISRHKNMIVVVGSHHIGADAGCCQSG